MKSKLGFHGKPFLKVDSCDKCNKEKRILIFGGVKLCEGCLIKAKQIIRKWVSKQPSLGYALHR